MTYVQGFVTPIPTANRQAFADHALGAARIFADLGTSRVVDAWGDDVPVGKVNDFRTAVDARDDETVGFGWMEFDDKAAGDAFYERMMADPRMAELGDMPFDGKRMILGGFETLIDDGASNGAGYVDGFLLAVPEENKHAYIEMAQLGSTVFREHGATRYVECWGVDVPAGEVTDMMRAVHAKPGEVVVFSWCEWPDKAARDAGNQKIMADERLGGGMANAPFDGSRMIYGGFSTIRA